LIVHPGSYKINYAIGIDRECFGSKVWPQVIDLVGDDPTHIIAAPAIHIHQDTVEMIVALDAKMKPHVDNYSARIYDLNDKTVPPVPIAHLTLNVF
jgi:hypothetical protein